MPSTTRTEPSSGVPRQTGADKPPRPRRAKVFYVSYDGLAEPLGRSQILPYLVRLAAEFDLTLVSFEKSPLPLPGLEAELAAAGIGWIPLRYHRRPPVLSTMFDMLVGRRALRRAVRARGRPAIVHVRSDVPALIALPIARRARAKLLFDIRGFWADERVEGRLWPRGVLYRLAKRLERGFFTQADAIVTLTHASMPMVKAWSGHRPMPIEVIPTCVDVGRFGLRPRRSDGAHVVWTGSLGTWYRFDLTARVAAALGLPLTVITRQEQLARQQLGGYPAEVLTLSPAEVPAHLFAGDIGLCLIAASFSKVASLPTRFAEYLAAGMPVLVTRGVGDLASIVAERGIGVVLEGEDQESIAHAASRLRALAAEAEVQERCRGTARALFDVNDGADRYANLYRRLLQGEG